MNTAESFEEHSKGQHDAVPADTEATEATEELKKDRLGLALRELCNALKASFKEQDTEL